MQYEFISLLVLVCINIAVAAFGYGKVNGKLDSFCARVESVEKINREQDNILTASRERLARLEGRVPQPVTYWQGPPKGTDTPENK